MQDWVQIARFQRAPLVVCGQHCRRFGGRNKGSDQVHADCTDEISTKPQTIQGLALVLASIGIHAQVFGPASIRGCPRVGGHFATVSFISISSACSFVVSFQSDPKCSSRFGYTRFGYTQGAGRGFDHDGDCQHLGRRIIRLDSNRSSYSTPRSAARAMSMPRHAHDDRAPLSHTETNRHTDTQTHATLPTSLVYTHKNASILVFVKCY